MALALVCASHSPFLGKGPVSDTAAKKVDTALSRLATFIRDFQPDYAIQFSPDHFNGFFYDAMPPFCVGAAAVSVGDVGCQAGPLDVPEQTALDLVRHLRGDDFDVAVSYRMSVDHGFVQVWETTLGTFREIPIVPVFVNGAAPPEPTYRRARMLGESVGRFAAQAGKRVLILASGGLSHDPPVPSMEDAAGEVRERLINGRDITPEGRRVREARMLEAAILSDAGKGPCQPLNPEWDASVMAMLCKGDIAGFDAFETDEVRRVAGRGGNETLSWVAACAAMRAGGPYTVEQSFYEAIPGWIVGFATLAARHT